jgi:uncharacterized membrane protein YfcA
VKGSGVSLEILAVMALALGGGGLVKGATGMGLPLVALPILAAFLGVQHAVALICLPVVFTNLWQVWRFRADLWTTDFLPRMFLGGAVGILVGTWLIVAMPERILSSALALLILVYIGLRLANPHFAITQPLGRRLAPAAGFGSGVLQGATGIGSPISVTFIHAMRLNRSAHVFAVSAMFLMFTTVQIPALAFAGILTWQIVLEGVVAMLPALITMPIGNWLAGRLSQQTFDRVVLALLAVVAIELVLKSFEA